MLVQPFLLMRNYWFMHDRSGNYIARDYAYNMLAPLAPNSFMFTNGDNDTFPLWYIQQVEGFRKDVRIVNLSLLNTDWYIRQIRDDEPKLDVQLDDRTIDQLGMGAVQDPQTGRIIYTNEFMVHHLLERMRAPDGSWKRQPYFAVTVPEHYGYDNLFALQGLVYEVKPDSTQAGLDVAATNKALYETFLYRGLFTKDGSWDPKVYKDENSETLSRNYAAAHLQLSLHYRRNGDLPKAITEMERITRMFPNFPEIQTPLGLFYMEARDTAKAFAFYDQLAKKFPGSPEARYYWGASLAIQGKMSEAIREFEMAVTLDPTYGQAYYGLYSGLRQMGDREAAIATLQRWVANAPNDPQALGLLQAEQGYDASPAPTRRPPLVPVP
jgi:Flp pilus assembly protein TadD